jgi:hypothetical protein
VNHQIVAVLIAEGSKLLGQYFRNRPIRIEAIQKTTETEQAVSVALENPQVNENKSTDIATGCVPCAIGHIGTCSGLLNEAVRFAKSDGMQSTEVIDRVGMCLDELNAMERVDLRPEMVTNLPAWEKELVDMVLKASRATRHLLEDLTSVESLEKAAAATQSLRVLVFREYMKSRVQHLSPEEQARVTDEVIGKLIELQDKEVEKELKAEVAE